MKLLFPLLKSFLGVSFQYQTMAASVSPRERSLGRASHLCPTKDSRPDPAPQEPRHPPGPGRQGPSGDEFRRTSCLPSGPGFCTGFLFSIKIANGRTVDKLPQREGGGLLEGLIYQHLPEKEDPHEFPSHERLCKEAGPVPAPGLPSSLSTKAAVAHPIYAS